MMGGMVADLSEFDKKNKEVDSKRREARSNTTMANANQINESMYNTTTDGDMRGTITDMDQTLVPAAKRALDKAEYDRRKLEEEEMKRQIEEERQRQLDQWGGVEDNL